MNKMTNNMSKSVESVAVLYQPYITRSMAVVAIVLTVSVFLYSAFLLEAVAHAASKTTAQNKIENISSHLSVLEAQYLQLTQSLTPQKAVELGFVAPDASVSIYARGDSSSLSFQGL